MTILEAAEKEARRRNISVEDVEKLALEIDADYAIYDFSIFENTKILKNLTSLELYGNGSCNLHGIENIPSLKRIKYNLLNPIYKSLLSLIPPNFIKELDLSNNKTISSLKGISNVEKLEVLNIRNTNISLFDADELSTLVYLSYLDISETSISKLDFLKNIKFLNYFRAQKTTIFDIYTLNGFTKLKTLDLAMSACPQIERINNLPQLRELNLQNVKLTTADFINNFKQLRKLILKNATVFSIDKITELYYLIYLDLGNSKIRSIANIDSLLSLKFLDLSNNEISDIEPLSRLTQLTYLDLSHTNIKSLKNLSTLTNLEVLILNHTSINSLEGIEKLTKLRYLDISTTYIKDLSKLKDLDKLNVLDISNTKVKKMPIFLINRVSAYRDENPRLSLSVVSKSNKFNKFVVYCSGVFNHLEKSIICSSEKNSRQYMQEIFEINAHTEYLKEARIIMLGAGDAGKTSLVNYITKGIYVENLKATKGVEISNTNMQIGNDIFKLHFWDLGGQEVYHPIHTLFMSKNSIYIIVLNGRNDEKPDEWLDYIKTFAPNAIVLIVINKLDENPRASINSSYYIEENPNIYNKIFKISCKYQFKGTSSVNDIKSAIAKIIKDNILDFKKIWPERWLNIKNHIEEQYSNNQEAYFSAEKYEEICENYGVDDNITQDIIKDTLDRFGVALSFSDEYQLLNPNWVIRGIYKMLECGNSDNNCIKKSEYNTVLSDLEGFKRQSQRNTILKMLSHKDLCFDVNNDDIFFPALLSEDKPMNIVLNPLCTIVYRFAYLPTYVLQKLMVKLWTNIYSNQSLIWKYGIYYQKNYTTVLIEEKNNELFVSLQSTDYHSNKETLREIRYAIKSIIKDLYNVNELIQFSYENEVEYLPYRTLEKLHERNINEYILPQTLIEINVNEIVNKYLDIFDYSNNEKQPDIGMPIININLTTNNNLSDDKYLDNILEALLDAVNGQNDCKELQEIKDNIHAIQKEISKNNKLLKKINRSDVNNKFSNLISNGANIATIAEFVKGLLMLL